MRVLVDTNVLLSAALRDRLPERVILHIGTGDEWVWLVTAEILDEYVSVLRRPKFGLTPEEIQCWADLLQLRTVCLSSPPVIEFLRDPKDAPFLAAAIAGRADYLITGDKDLLESQSLVPARVLTVSAFSQIFDIK